MALRAYELADRLRARGKTVVFGGLHATYRPDEAKEHADVVFIGEAEGIWQQMLADYENGALKPFYKREDSVDLAEVPIPDRSLYDGYSYSNPVNYLQVSRGCALPCSGCPIPSAYGAMRFRPLELVERELESFPAQTLYITDDNMFFMQRECVTYMGELLRVLARFDKPSSWASAIGVPRRYDEDFSASRLPPRSPASTMCSTTPFPRVRSTATRGRWIGSAWCTTGIARRGSTSGCQCT